MKAGIRSGAHAFRYNQAFDEVDEVVRPHEASYARHVYHIYAIRLHERDEVMWILKEKGIQCGVHYPVPIHLQKAYRSLGYKVGAFPISERIAREFISLPMFPELTETQVETVVVNVKEAIIAGVMV